MTCHFLIALDPYGPVMVPTPQVCREINFSRENFFDVDRDIWGLFDVIFHVESESGSRFLFRVKMNIFIF